MERVTTAWTKEEKKKEEEALSSGSPFSTIGYPRSWNHKKVFTIIFLEFACTVL